MHHLKQTVPTASPTESPTASPTESPTLNPTKPKRVVELVLALVVEEALTEAEQTLTCEGITSTTSEEMNVEERYITCSISINEQQVRRRRRLLAVSYDIALSISIPETDPPFQKIVGDTDTKFLHCVPSLYKKAHFNLLVFTSTKKAFFLLPVLFFKSKVTR